MKHVQTIYGEGILNDELSALGRYVVVTGRRTWSLYQSDIRVDPADVIVPQSLERSELEGLLKSVPDDAQIAGMGGGMVIDVAKYLAHERGKTPLLVPTITSSNAQFSDTVSVRQNGSPVGTRFEGAPRRIIVDYSLIRKADPRLNRAGYGDVLALYTTLNDWRISAEAGRAQPVDQDVSREVERLMDQAIQSAPEIGEVSQQGIETLMKLFESTLEVITNNPKAPMGAGAEHLFAWNLESITGRHFVHGEIVSLGILIASYLQRSGFDRLRTALREARIPYGPGQIGITEEEFKTTLRTVQEYNREARKLNTVFDLVEWTPDLLDELYEMSAT